jgi:hypothetical protein
MRDRTGWCAEEAGVATSKACGADICAISGAKLSAVKQKPSALILLFAEDKAALVKGLSDCKRLLEPGGALWVAYIKGTSTRKTDINRNSIRDYVATIGLDTVSQIAIDDDWSALRLKVV